MSKRRLVAKTGEYQKDGATKGEYTNIGVELHNDNGPYLLLDPSVSLSGVLAKQNVLAMTQGKPVRDSVMVSVFDDQQAQQNQTQSQQPQQGYQQPNQNQGYQQPHQGYQNK